jgi:hypothetical protein
METIAWISIGIAVLCALLIAWDEVRRPQQMAVMNIVWPTTALYFSIFALWAYIKTGRARGMPRNQTGAFMNRDFLKGKHSENERRGPTLEQVVLGASHCGAGCMLADVFSEFGIAHTGIVLFGSVLVAEYAIDFVAAWSLGIAFQYFAVKPMRNLKPLEALVSAAKADTLSIVAFQIGMFAWMAIVYYLLFPHPHLTPFQPGYWLMMQIGMICGYATTLPMNWWLIKAGIKEPM